MMYYEDMEVGSIRVSKETYAVTAEEIKSYARQWDPMPFHVDEEFASQTPMGGLFASSLHTISIGVKLGHTMKDGELAIIAALGWDEMRFPKPVFVGDVLRAKTEIIGKRVSKSKPDQGIIQTQMSVLNQNDEIVATYKISNLVFCRPEES